MCPTSIAVRNSSAPSQFGQRSPSLRLADVGEARLVVAPGLDAAQMPARRGSRRRRTGRRAASRRRSPRAASRSGRATRRSRRTPCGSPRRSRAAKSSPSAVCSRGSLSRSSPRMSASTTVPSGFVTGIAFVVAASSIAEELGEAVDRAHAGRLDLARARRALGERGARGTPAATSMSAAKSPLLAGHEHVLPRARRARGSRSTRCRPSSRGSAWTA